MCPTELEALYAAWAGARLAARAERRGGEGCLALASSLTERYRRLETLAYSEGIAGRWASIVTLSLDARQEPSDGEGWTNGWSERA